MEYIKPNFYESVKAYLNMNYHERMQHNEELFKQAQTKEELINLFNLFDNCGVHTYEERLLLRIMGLATTIDDWKWLEFNGRYYYGIYQTASDNLKNYESVNGLFFYLKN